MIKLIDSRPIGAGLEPYSSTDLLNSLYSSRKNAYDYLIKLIRRKLEGFRSITDELNENNIYVNL